MLFFQNATPHPPQKIGAVGLRSYNQIGECLTLEHRDTLYTQTLAIQPACTAG